MKFLLVEAPNFSRWRDDYFAGDDDFAAFQRFVMDNPLTGSVSPGAGGIRKIRWAGSGHGKRGGLRIVYLLLPEHCPIYLIDVYAKNERTDLAPAERDLLAELAADYRASLPAPLKRKKP